MIPPWSGVVYIMNQPRVHWALEGDGGGGDDDSDGDNEDNKPISCMHVQQLA